MRTVLVCVAEVRAETDLALLFVLPTDEDDSSENILDKTDGENVWVPKSVIEDADDIAVGDEDIEVEVAEWFAEKEGLV